MNSRLQSVIYSVKVAAGHCKRPGRQYSPSQRKQLTKFSVIIEFFFIIIVVVC